MVWSYDEGYKNCACFWGREPASFVRLLANYEPCLIGRKVLDAGCGEGKNAAFLAQKGADVDAFDFSSLAIENGRRFWKLVPNIRWQIADVRDLVISPMSYDVVIAYGLLHCLASRDEVLEGIARLQAATCAGGYNVLCAFNDRGHELKAHPGFEPCLLPHADYLAAYSSWEILAQSDSDLTEKHPHNNIEHTHSLTRLLARRRPG